MKITIFSKLSKFEYKKYSKYDAGDLKNRLESDVGTFEKFLNSHCKNAILSSIKTLSKEKTIISIAHRLSSILETDRVIIMDNGEIITSGKHEELKGKNAIYDILFKAQYVAEGE